LWTIVLKVRFVPSHASFNDWKPLFDSPLVPDTWVTNGAFAFSYPARPDDQCLSPSSVFDGVRQERYDDPEVQGGKIALIAVNSKTVQTPPNFLDRMTTRKQKQVAYNERLLQAEYEIAGISTSLTLTSLKKPLSLLLSPDSSVKIPRKFKATLYSPPLFRRF
jgi:hypothetical protein